MVLLRKRLFAAAYDFMLTCAVLFCATMFYTAVVVTIFGNAPTPQYNTDQVLTELEPVKLGALFYLYIMAVFVGFHGYFMRNGGQTLGMKTWKLKLVSVQNGNLSTTLILKRLMLSIPSTLLFLFGWFYMLLNQERSTLHDKLSQTKVIAID